MSERTVPTEPDDFKQEIPSDESYQDSEQEGNDLAERAKTHKGETKNRDESEFTYDGLKTPDVTTDLPEVQDESK